MNKLDELLSLNGNYMKSALIMFFSEEELNQAIPLLDEERKVIVEKELRRRYEKQEEEFTEEEWEDFREKWDNACREIRGGK